MGEDDEIDRTASQSLGNDEVKRFAGIEPTRIEEEGDRRRGLRGGVFDDARYLLVEGPVEVEHGLKLGLAEAGNWNGRGSQGRRLGVGFG